MRRREPRWWSTCSRSALMTSAQTSSTSSAASRKSRAAWVKLPSSPLVSVHPERSDCTSVKENTTLAIVIWKVCAPLHAVILTKSRPTHMYRHSDEQRGPASHVAAPRQRQEPSLRAEHPGADRRDVRARPRTRRGRRNPRLQLVFVRSRIRTFETLGLDAFGAVSEGHWLVSGR